MTYQIIDGKKVAEEVRTELKQLGEEMQATHGVTPGIAVILVGERPDSATYVRMKKKAAAEVGFISREKLLPDTCSEEEVLAAVSRFNADPEVHGILVQLPLPPHINEQKVLGRIMIEKDVDGFDPANIGALALKGVEPKAISCTPYGVIELLKRYKIEIAGKNAVVVGRSNIVGMPVALLLIHENATVTVCHSKTKDLPEVVKGADIVVAAIGRAKFIKGDWVKEGAVVIDVGINSVEDSTKKSGYRLVGDVDYDEVKEHCSYITPVPGGVGPMTIAMLLKNTVVVFLGMRTPAHHLALEINYLENLWQRRCPSRGSEDELRCELLGQLSKADSTPVEKYRFFTRIRELPLHSFIRDGEMMGVFPGTTCLYVRALLGGLTPTLALDICHKGDASFSYDKDNDQLIVMHTMNTRVSVYDMTTGVFLKLYVIDGFPIHANDTRIVSDGKVLVASTVGHSSVYLYIVRLEGEGVFRRSYLLWYKDGLFAMKIAPALSYHDGIVEMAVGQLGQDTVIYRFEMRTGNRPVALKMSQRKLVRNTDASFQNRGVWFIGEQWLAICYGHGDRTVLMLTDKFKVTAPVVPLLQATGMPSGLYHSVTAGPDDTVNVIYSMKDDSASCSLVTIYF